MCTLRTIPGGCWGSVGPALVFLDDRDGYLDLWAIGGREIEFLGPRSYDILPGRYTYYSSTNEKVIVSIMLTRGNPLP